MDANEKRRLFMEMKALKQNRLNEEVREDYTSLDTPSESVQTIHYDDGRKYIGNLSNGDRLEGMWKEDKPVHGTYYFADGDKYEGDFDEYWKRSGQGTLHFADGEKLEGTWKEGKPVHGTYYFADGNRYEGDFDEDWHYSGQGTYYFSNGKILKGQWLKDKYLGDVTNK